MVNCSQTLAPAHLQAVEVEQITSNKDSVLGCLLAATIFGLWGVSLACFLSLDISQLPLLLTPVAIAWQMFLFTGLFITAHDAMHGVIAPQRAEINTWIGRIAVAAYALFSYQKLLKKHWSHHRHPASDRDPDYHDGIHTNPFAWYFHFMKGYWSWQQLVGFVVVHFVATSILHISEINLILFWILPLVLSSIQLFYFGTFLTHREPVTGYTNSYRARSNPLPIFWSFVTCYHFGYHEEHHAYPHAAWWQLPKVRSYLSSTAT